MRRSTRITFEGSQATALAGRLELPTGPPIGYAIFAHCFTCSKDSFAASRIAKGLAERGVAVLRFDFTGLGSSEGDFANTDFSSNVDDLVLAASFLRESYAAPTLLIGHSLGGAAVLVAAQRIPEATVVATIGAPSDVAHLASVFESASTEDGSGDIEVSFAGRRFPMRRRFFEDVSRQNLTAAIANLRRALVVFHSPVDGIVGIEHARRIYDAALHPKSFVSLDHADHFLTDPQDSAFVADSLAALAGRYMGRSETGAAAASRVKRGEVVVSETGEGKYTQTVQAGPHVVSADEPPGVGRDAGPNPYDLLLAALGTCTSMTLRMYADRQGWPLERVSVRLSRSRIHAADCATCETKDGMLDSIERIIDLRGGLTRGQQERLMQIAERCPVHRTLMAEKEIVTRLAARADDIEIPMAARPTG